MNILKVLHTDSERIVQTIRDSSLPPLGFDFLAAGWALELHTRNKQKYSFTPLFTVNEKGFRVGTPLVLPYIDRSNDLSPIPFADYPTWTFGRFLATQAGPSGVKPSEAEILKKAAKAPSQNAAYLQALEACAQTIGDPVYAFALDFLRSTEIDLPETMSNDQRILLRVDGEFLHDREDFQAYWTDIFRAKFDSDKEGICQLSGQKRKLARLLPAIKNLSKAKMDSKMFLVSSNFASAERWGQQNSESASVDLAEYAKIQHALHALVSSKKHCYYESGLVCVFWCRDADVPMVFCNPERDTQKIKDFIASVRLGHTAHERPSEDGEVHCFILGANSNRLVPRLQIRSSLAEMERRQADWLEAIGADNVRHLDKIPALSVQNILESLYLDSKDVTSLARETLLRVALTGSPLPDSIVSMAINRYQMARYDDAKQRLDTHRIAVIRYYLQQERIKNMDNHSVYDAKAYKLGRLFQELESLQFQAIQPNNPLSDQHFATASTYPLAVFSQLISMSKHYLAKLGPKGHSQDKVITKLISEIGAYPERLSLKERSEFILGYHDAREEMFSRIEKAKNKIYLADNIDENNNDINNENNNEVYISAQF